MSEKSKKRMKDMGLPLGLWEAVSTSSSYELRLKLTSCEMEIGFEVTAELLEAL